jgi:hypothetical protein
MTDNAPASQRLIQLARLLHSGSKIGKTLAATYEVARQMSGKRVWIVGPAGLV